MKIEFEPQDNINESDPDDYLADGGDHCAKAPGSGRRGVKAKRVAAGAAFAVLLLAVNVIAGLYSRADSFISYFNLDSPTAYMLVDDTCRLDYTVDYSLPLVMADADITWRSGDSGVVSVNEQGDLTAVAPGKAVITASVDEGRFSSECEVTVSYRGQIVLPEEPIAIGQGETITVAAEIAGSTGEAITLCTQDTSVAVADGAQLRGVSMGSTVLTASAQGYEPASCQVEVCAAPTVVLPENAQFNIGLGENYRMCFTAGQGEACRSYTYQSSDTSVAEVSADGIAAAKSKGSADITVTAFNGVSTTCRITVLDEPKSVALPEKPISMYSGETLELSPDVGSAGCMTYTYSSSNPDVASVDASGRITAGQRGSATVTCTTFNGKQTSCKVVVSIVNYNQKYVSQRVYDNIKALETTYPGLIKTEVIGQSVRGRDLVAIKLGTGGKQALIVSGMHANENTAINFTMRCVEEYAEAYYSDSGKYGQYDIKSMLNEYTLYIVPMVNPDGLDIVNNGELPEYTGGEIPDSGSRTGNPWDTEYTANANGVNLNRNFPFRWDKITSSTAGPHISKYRGSAPASEPETQALIKLCSEHSFEWMFSMHVRGDFIYWCDDYNGNVPGARELANKLRKNCGFDLQGPSRLKNLGGGFENWFRDEYDRPGFCIELIDINRTKFIKDGNFERITEWPESKYTFIQGMLK